MIGVLNYGLGNINSIVNIIKHVGGNSKIISKYEDLSGISKLIIPGVGSFDHGMNCLIKNNWIQILNDFKNKKENKVLGICLGMQLMCNNSEEGNLSGLGWINANVVKFSFENEMRIPHMGWNNIELKKDSKLFSSDFQRYYFVHSYHAVCNEFSDISSTTNYGFDVTASFEHNNIYGVQFHPEKSHRFGKEFFKKFIEL